MGRRNFAAESKGKHGMFNPLFNPKINFMASVSIVFRKEKTNKKGEAPIHFRITKYRKSHYVASGIMVPEAKWDDSKKKVKSGHKNSARLNSYLANKFAELQDSVLEHETISRSLSSRKLRDKVFGKVPSNFFAFADRTVEKYKNEGKIGSYHKNLSIIAKLRAYNKSENLTFHDITPGFLLKYEDHLRLVCSNKTNTINKDMRFLRKIFNDAIRQETIEYESSPFRKYQMKLEKTHRDYLTEEELERIYRYPAPAGTRIELHADMFVFSAYTGGIRISDMLQLQWSDFDGTHLNIRIKKSGTQVSIKVPNRGLEIINRYKSGGQNPGRFIFPMLPETLDLKNPVFVDAAISSASAYVNKNLKLIAGDVGIEKNLSFHIARHTFAVRALRKGISIDKVSKLLAHAAIRETQIYAKIVNEDLDNAMDVFNVSV